MLRELLELSLVTSVILVMAFVLLGSYDCKFLFKWYDFWIGIFIDRTTGKFYFLFFPTLGFVFDLLPKEYYLKEYYAGWVIYHVDSRGERQCIGSGGNWLNAMYQARTHHKNKNK